MRSHLKVSFDGGTSISKKLYTVNDGLIKYMTMGSESLKLTESAKKKLLKTKEMGLPEDNAWIETGNQIWGIGRIAKQYRGTTKIKPLKVTFAVPKIMASIGAIAEREKLEQEIDLDLAILLPYSEITSQEQLSQDLKVALENFKFRGRSLSVNLNGCEIVPEATGIAFLHNLKKPEEFQSTIQVYLMLGHRNTSLMVFERGSFSPMYSSTTTLGFYECIDKFREKIPGIEREDLLKALRHQARVTYNWNERSYSIEDKKISIDFSGIRQLGDKRDIKEIETAFFESLAEYWRLISDWLDESSLSLNAIDKFWVCGGVAPFLRAYLQKKITPLKLEMLTAETNQLWKALGFSETSYPKEFIEQNLAERMMDVWGIYSVYFGYFEQEKVAV